MRLGGCNNAKPLYLAILDRHLHRPAFFPWRLLRLSGRRQIQGHVRTTMISMITAHDDAVQQELLRQTQNDCKALALQAHDATRVQTCCSLNGCNGPSRDPATLGVLQQLKSVLNVSIVLETWNNAAEPLQGQQGFAKGLSKRGLVLVRKKSTCP